MLIAALKESVARNRELIKSHHARWFSESTAAKAQAVAIPLKKSAAEDKTTVLTAFRVMQVVYQK